MNLSFPRLQSKSLENLAKSLAFVLFVWQFLIIFRYSVNVPAWDEWEYALGLDRPLTFSYLLSQHKAHQILPTKFLHWLLFRVTDGNFVTEQVVSYLIFGAMIALLATLLRKASRRIPPMLIYLSACFLLSNISWENQTSAFRNQFHFVNLFFLLTIYFLFYGRSWLSIVPATIFSFLTVSSFTSGVAMIASLVVVFGFYCLIKRQGGYQPSRNYFFVFTLTSLLSILCWTMARQGSDPQYQFTYPWKPDFWEFWLNLLSTSFSFGEMPTWFGGVILFFILFPWLLMLKDRRFYFLRSGQTFSLLAMAIGFLFGTAMYAMHRADRGVDVARNWKCAEVGFLLVPLVFVTWYLAVESYRQTVRLAVFLLVAGLISVGYADNWNYSVYQKSYSKKTQEQKCISKFYRETAPVDCNFLYPGPIYDQLKKAKARGYSWAVDAMDIKKGQ